MISSTLVWIFVGTFALVWFLNRKRGRKGTREIPGPKGWPVIGNAHELGKLQHLQFNKWTKEYGDIYQVMLGPHKNVVISNPKMMKEILSDSNYVGRPHFDGFDIYEDDQLGIVNSEGELWEVHRRFLLRQLRDFGFGKSAMESLIMEELNEVLGLFKESEGKPVSDVKRVMTLAVITSLWSVVSCQRFKHDDPKLLRQIENTSKVVGDLFESGGLLIFLPWLKKFCPELSGYKPFRRAIEESRSWFEEIVEEHKQSFQEDNIRDFMDVYLAEMKKTTDPDSVFYGARAVLTELERMLVATIEDLFFAGSDTTSSTLAWAFLYLCKFPHTQQKFQEEIAAVTSNSRNVSVADRPNMPYTLALIDEVLRLSSIAPTGVQHRALEDKEFQGYYIPKDAWVISNLHYMHRDPKLWEEPEEFKPERFLSPDGKKYQKSENLLPFQIGRRQCVGETHARDTIFLYLTNIFQRFEMKFDPNSREPTMDSQPSFVLYPQPYSVVMKDRMQ